MEGRASLEGNAIGSFVLHEAHVPRPVDVLPLLGQHAPSLGAGGEGLLETSPAAGWVDGDVVKARERRANGAAGLMEGPAAVAADEGAQPPAHAGQTSGIPEKTRKEKRGGGLREKDKRTINGTPN